MRRKKRRKKIIIGIILTLIIVTSSVFIYIYLNEKDLINIDLNLAPEEEEEEIIPITIVDIDSTSRPYAVMINNLSTARPYHSGLQDAYLMYEIIVEGGVTRYMALFKDTETEVIGSVRSSRHYYLDYVLENDAYYVHWGWSDQAQSDISSLGIDNINGLTYEGTYFYRESSLPISYEHTGYTTMTMIKSAVEALGYRTETNVDLLLDYSALAIEYTEDTEVIEASRVDIEFSYSTTSNFVYDEENEYYLMSVNDAEHTDYITGEQYHFKNIITYQVENYTMEGETQRQDLENIGSGTGYYISNGIAVEITWEKTSRESQTVYKLLSGEEIVVNDGNTYIGIQPLDEELTIS